MNATLESLFGPPSDPIDIPAFIRTAAELDTTDSGPDPALADECSVADLRDSLFDTWNNPTLSAYLSKDNEHNVTSLYSTTKSAKPKRRVNLPDPDTLPSEVIALQKQLDSVNLTSWKLNYDVASFIRPSKNSDQNALAQVKPAPEPSVRLSDELCAIITVTVHTRSTWSSGYVNRSSQHALLSSQSLGDLVRVIRCVSDEIAEEDSMDTREPESRPPTGAEGCVICIENVAYGDGLTDNDYAQKLMRHLQSVSKDAPPLTVAPTTIYETRLSSLPLRINQPYWLLHQGNCEHFVVVDQIRLQHPSDVTTGYPLTLQITPALLDLCRACSKVPASLSVVGDIRLGESPCLLCASCWRHMGDPDDPNIIVKQLPRYELGR
ncbi:putative snRNA-activating protein of 50kDa MW C terminal [Lyophyllum shimeji]|uniref:snRNA-activating protein of 50kDa MW C terminal n=1 Tax=Lyophyllum shimeji TaxID=47721 RepID=A0A9P3PLG5_LYOSH|nr:putative snRNA-activating protein of 50kDa MW C terminal [Lyophyllum shimeji]